MSNCNCCKRNTNCFCSLFSPSGDIININQQRGALAPCFLKVSISGYKPHPNVKDILQVEGCDNTDNTYYMSMYKCADSEDSPWDRIGIDNGQYVMWRGAPEIDTINPYDGYGPPTFAGVYFNIEDYERYKTITLHRTIDTSQSGNITNVSTVYTSGIIGRPLLTLDSNPGLSKLDYIGVLQPNETQQFVIYRIKEVDGLNIELDVLRSDLEKMHSYSSSYRVLELDIGDVVYPLRYQWEFTGVGDGALIGGVSDYFSQVESNVDTSLTITTKATSLEFPPYECSPSGATVSISSMNPSTIIDLTSTPIKQNSDFKFCSDDIGNYVQLRLDIDGQKINSVMGFDEDYHIPYTDYFDVTITGVSGLPCCSGLNATRRLSYGPRYAITNALLFPYPNFFEGMGFEQYYHRFSGDIYHNTEGFLCGPGFSRADDAICGRDCAGNNKCYNSIYDVDLYNYPCINLLGLEYKNTNNTTLEYRVGIGYENADSINLSHIYASGAKTIPIDSGLPCSDMSTNYTTTLSLNAIENISGEHGATGCDFSSATATIIPHFKLPPAVNQRPIICSQNYIRYPKIPTSIQIDVVATGEDGSGETSCYCQLLNTVGNLNGESFILDWDESQCRYVYTGAVYSTDLFTCFEAAYGGTFTWENETIYSYNEGLGRIIFYGDIYRDGVPFDIFGSYYPNSLWVEANITTDIYLQCENPLVDRCSSLQLGGPIVGGSLSNCAISHCYIDYDNFTTATYYNRGFINQSFCVFRSYEITLTATPL